MTRLTNTDADNVWTGHLSNILETGRKVFPRGKETLERLGMTINVDMRRCFVQNLKRKADHRFAAAEAYWILSGDNRVETISKYAKKMREYSMDGYFLDGAYGPPVIDQLPYVTRALSVDPASRQAVMTLWRPRPYHSMDTPCTVSIQFILRDETIHTMVYMRSSDAWLGLPYDMFTFSAITSAVSVLLTDSMGRFRLGILKIFIGSAHIYSHDVPKAMQAINGGYRKSELVEPMVSVNAGMFNYNSFMGKLKEIARWKD